MSAPPPFPVSEDPEDLPVPLSLPFPVPEEPEDLPVSVPVSLPVPDVPEDLPVSVPVPLPVPDVPEDLPVSVPVAVEPLLPPLPLPPVVEPVPDPADFLVAPLAVELAIARLVPVVPEIRPLVVALNDTCFSLTAGMAKLLDEDPPLDELLVELPFDQLPSEEPDDAVLPDPLLLARLVFEELLSDDPPFASPPLLAERVLVAPLSVESPPDALVDAVFAVPLSDEPVLDALLLVDAAFVVSPSVVSTLDALELADPVLGSPLSEESPADALTLVDAVLDAPLSADPVVSLAPVDAEESLVPAVEPADADVLVERAAGCATAGLAEGLVLVITWLWLPCTVSAPRLLAVMLAISPGCATKRARPSVVETSTAPSTTCTDAPLSSTVTLNVVPLTTAARYGVCTEKCGVVPLRTL